MKTTHPQIDRLRKHFLSGRRLTKLEALDKYGCMNLGGRVYDLRAEGLDIAHEMILTPSKKRVARYFLNK